MEHYCRKDKSAKYSIYGLAQLTPAFLEELYVGSRKKFAEFY